MATKGTGPHEGTSLDPEKCFLIRRRNIMRKMQKIAALGLAGTMALSLAACGGSGDSTADTTSTAESTASSTEATAESTGSGDEAVTLNWALWDKDSTAYWQALADGYMESHPNVTIEMTDLGSTDYMTQLATQLAGGNGELDVLSIKDIPGYSNLINLGMLEPLSGKLTTDESKFNGVLEQLTAEDGNYYAVPFRSDFWVVYYNKDIFDQAGVEYPTNDMTMADFDAKIREVNEKAGVYGNIYHTWRSTTTLFGILDGQHTVIDGNYDFLKPYYEQVLSEQADGVIPNYGEQKTSGLHYSGAFENGQAAMCNMGSWFIATMMSNLKSGEYDSSLCGNWGIVKYPHAEGVEPGSTLGTITGLAVTTITNAGTMTVTGKTGVTVGKEVSIANTGDLTFKDDAKVDFKADYTASAGRLFIESADNTISGNITADSLKFGTRITDSDTAKETNQVVITGSTSNTIAYGSTVDVKALTVEVEVTTVKGALKAATTTIGAGKKGGLTVSDEDAGNKKFAVVTLGDITVGSTKEKETDAGSFTLTNNAENAVEASSLTVVKNTNASTFELGAGKFSVGKLTNQGTVTLTDGEFSLTGEGSNASGATINLADSATASLVVA